MPEKPSKPLSETLLESLRDYPDSDVLRFLLVDCGFSLDDIRNQVLRSQGFSSEQIDAQLPSDQKLRKPKSPLKYTGQDTSGIAGHIRLNTRRSKNTSSTQ